MKISDAIRVSSLAAIGAVALGCATSGPTSELVDAREAYDQAAHGIANKYAPDKVLQAQLSLEQAERAHEDRPGSQAEQHYAYVAQREALLAIQDGAQAQLRHQETEYEDEYVSQLQQQRDEAYALLGSAATSMMSSEQRRADAERRYKAAMKSLEEYAQISHEQRGMVITLNGQVLFEFDSAKLLPIAEQRLEAVAVALKSPDHEGTITIEGHTDAQGSAAYNRKLSKERANAVKEFLVSKGVSPERIRTQGEGESQPIASNATPEGRANNRRVEIVIPEPERARTARR